MKPPSSMTSPLAFVLAALIILNVVWLQSTFLGTSALLLLLLVAGTRFGTTFFGTLGRTTRTLLGALLVMTWISVFGSLFYYSAVLNAVTISIIIASIPVLVSCFARVPPIPTEKSTSPLYEKPLNTALLLIAYASFLLIAFRQLLRVEIVDSIRSPWEVLPWQFFLMVFLATATLVVLALARTRITPLLAIPFFFLFFSVTALTYPLGYGFDPFIHQATESYIATHGTITPKPVTYIGQYTVVNVLHASTTLPIPALDRWLLPVLLALFLPIAGWAAFKKPLAIVLLPLLPMSTFAVTTPQAVANALLLITILLAIASRDGPRRALVALWLLGLGTALTHPIAGVPLLLFLVFWSLRKPAIPTSEPQAPDFTPIKRIPSWFDPVRPVLMGAAALSGAVALPILFTAYGLISGVGTGVRTDAFTRIPVVLNELVTSFGGIETRFNFLLDFVYVYGLNLVPLLLIAALGTAIILFRRGVRWVGWLLFTSFLVFVNAVLLEAGIDFSFLPLYEQSGYAARLFDIAKLFLLPLAVAGLVPAVYLLIKKHGVIVRVGVITLLAGFLTTSLYLTYPHPDAYTIERGFNVGAQDFEAVQFIEKNAAGEAYIVLSNQAVSAAALKEFGFKQYFDFQTDSGPKTSFYYPIPTGGELYPYYLEMVYDAPRTSIIEDALTRAGVELGYFVVNQYWSESEAIIEQAKGQTDTWWSTHDGAVHVFRFEK